MAAMLKIQHGHHTYCEKGIVFWIENVLVSLKNV